MYEYQVEACKVKDAQEKMNELAKLGWKVIAVSPNLENLTKGLVITFERQVG